jgi:hypothetical protein
MFADVLSGESLEDVATRKNGLVVNCVFATLYWQMVKWGVLKTWHGLMTDKGFFVKVRNVNKLSDVRIRFFKRRGIEQFSHADCLRCKPLLAAQGTFVPPPRIHTHGTIVYGGSLLSLPIA